MTAGWGFFGQVMFAETRCSFARRPYRAVAVKRLRRSCALLRPLRDDRADATGRWVSKA